VIALDTNLLVYAHREESRWHQQALAVVRECAESPARWAIPWPCLHEFLGVITHPRIYAPPTPLEKALAGVRALTASPSLVFIGEGPDHLRLLAQLATAGRIAGSNFHDAKIAAICLAHGVRELWSADRDFARFPQLKVVNPLAG
jgi:toxin-antitoxin system PIN domain toxin